MTQTVRSTDRLNFSTAVLSFATAIITLAVLIAPAWSSVAAWILSAFRTLANFGLNRLSDLFVGLPGSIVLVIVGFRWPHWKRAAISIACVGLLVVVMRIIRESTIPDFMKLVGVA